MRQLRDGQDVDQIEKELDRLDPGLVMVTFAQEEASAFAAGKKAVPTHRLRLFIWEGRAVEAARLQSRWSRQQSAGRPEWWAVLADGRRSPSAYSSVSFGNAVL